MRLSTTYKELAKSAIITKNDNEREKRNKKRYFRDLKIAAGIYHRGDRVKQILLRLSKYRVLYDVYSVAIHIAELYGSNNPSATIRDYDYVYANAIFNGKYLFCSEQKFNKILKEGDVIKLIEYISKNPKKVIIRACNGISKH